MNSPSRPAIGIQAIEVVVAERPTPIEELPEVQALDQKQRHLFSKVMLEMETVSVIADADACELAIAASKRSLATAGLTAEQLDLIIFCQGRAPAHLMSSEVTRLHKALGASGASCFTVADLGCVNVSMALVMAKNHLLANPSAQHVLIAAGSKPYGPGRYRDAVTVIGDAGLGVVVSRTASHRIVDVKFKTDGKYWDLWVVDYKNVLASEFKETLTSRPRQFELAISSKLAFEKLNQELLAAHGLGPPAAYIMQNLSVTALRYNEDNLKIKLAPSCVESSKKYGHLGNADILLNYQRAFAAGEFKTGDFVVVMNVSPTACWSSMLVEV